LLFTVKNTPYRHTSPSFNLVHGCIYWYFCFTADDDLGLYTVWCKVILMWKNLPFPSICFSIHLDPYSLTLKKKAHGVSKKN